MSSGPKPIPELHKDVRAVGGSGTKGTLGVSPGPSPPLCWVRRPEGNVKQLGSQIWNQTWGVKRRQPWVRKQVFPRGLR